MSIQCFFDTETTGLTNWKLGDNHPSQPNMIQLAAILSDENQIYAEVKCIVHPGDVHPEWVLGEEAASIHGISKEMVELAGIPTLSAARVLVNMMRKADQVVCHNVDFDKKLLQIALARGKQEQAIDEIFQMKWYCTMKKSTNLLKIPPHTGRSGYKWPRLLELHQYLFGETFEGAHDALNDVRATAQCFYELQRRGL